MSIATHHTNLYTTEYCKFSADDAVKKLISMGCPKSKIVIGVAYYSRGSSGTEGLGKPRAGLSTDSSWETGIVDYKDLPKPGAKEFYDEKAGANYSYDSSKKILNSYDSMESVTAKCKYVIANDLGGIIVWESSGDRPVSSGKSLTKLIFDKLSKPKTPAPTIPLPPVPTPKPNPAPAPAPVPVPTPKPPVVNGPSVWKPDVVYRVAVKVIFKGAVYTCTKEHISGEITPSYLNYWKPVLPPIDTTSKCDYKSGRIKSITVDIKNVIFN